MIEPGLTNPIAFKSCITVNDTASHSGYNVQYLRRLLREGRLSGVKLGQTWLLDKCMFESYLENANHIPDKRFGPK